MILYFIPISLVYRSVIAFFLTFLFFLLTGKRIIRWLEKKEMVDYFRLNSPLRHKSKKGTPSGGGIFILLFLGVIFFLLGDISNHYIYLVFFVTFCLGFIGFTDDIAKKLRKNSRGLSTRFKLVLQTTVAIVAALLIYYFYGEINTCLIIPFTHFKMDLGFSYFILITFMILSSSNAVNVTDGLDGLAAGCAIAPAAILVAISLVQSNVNLSSFFNRPYLPGSGELIFFWCAFSGALLGFLKYNRFPAKMFMGGVGSEALGGALGISAILLKAELLFLFIGGIFVIEILSVGIQVTSYRLTGKRVFKMTPLHHHFELSGLKETRIVTSFWVISALFSVIAFLSIIYSSVF